jgi:predicted nucleic acid-binding protein
MRKVVSNTTPILSLLKINQLLLLKELYGKIIIPKAVFQEIENGKDKQYYQDLSLLSWIEITKIKNTDSKENFNELDSGEAEVLIVAKEQNADLVIMDEIIGRRFARQLSINITGTIGILLKAKEKGLINSVTKLLTELTNKGTWLNTKLVSKAIELAGEKYT